MVNNLILTEAVADLSKSLGTEFHSIRVARAVVGLYFTGVALDCGTAGACTTPAKNALHEACCPTGNQAMLLPGTLRGRPAIELLDEVASTNRLRRALGIATLNALAELCWQTTSPSRCDAAHRG